MVVVEVVIIIFVLVLPPASTARPLPRAAVAMGLVVQLIGLVVVLVVAVIGLEPLVVPRAGGSLVGVVALAQPVPRLAVALLRAARVPGLVGPGVVGGGPCALGVERVSVGQLGVVTPRDLHVGVEVGHVGVQLIGVVGLVVGDVAQELGGAVCVTWWRRRDTNYSSVKRQRNHLQRTIQWHAHG